MRWIVPLVAALVPLVLTPGWLSHFDVTPKVAILLLGSTLILFYWRVNVHNFYKLWRQPEGRWFGGLIAGAWVSIVLATAVSTHALLSLNGSNWRRMGLIGETGLLIFISAAAGWLAANRSNIRLLLRACTAAGAIAAAYGIAQYFGWDPFMPVKAYEVGEGQYMIVRPPGTLGHADYFAAWLVVVVFLGLAVGRLETEKWRVAIAVCESGLAAAAIVLSGTRSAMLGVLAGGIVWLVMGRVRIGLKSLMGGAACVALLAVFFFSPAGLRLRARLHWSIEDARGGARMLLWRDSARMAAHRPLTGYGPETFATEFARFESMDLARAFPDFYHESPHNIFLDALTAEGVLGTAALLGLCGLGGWCAVRARRRGNTLTGPVAAALAGLLVTQQFIVFVLATSLYFYLLIAVLLAIAGSEAERADGSIRLSRAWVAVPAALVVLFAGYAVRLVVADSALGTAQRRIASGDAPGAAEAYRTVLKWQLPGTGDDLSYSRAMQELAARSPIFATRLAAREQALEAGARAVSSAEDRQNAWYNLATLLAGNNDAAGVERALRSAIAWAPNWFKPHWTLAQVLALTGHSQEALAEGQAAVERDGGRDEEVNRTLETLKAAGREQ